MSVEELLDSPAVAKWLGVPERTLSQWRYLQRGPRYVVVGKHIRYRRADVESWLTEHTVDLPSRDPAA
jgi:hypothetical protein